MRHHLAHLLPHHIGDAGVARVGGVRLDVNIVAQQAERPVEKFDDAEPLIDGIEQRLVALLAQRKGFASLSALLFDGGSEAGVLVLQRFDLKP
jgi:hypothetical protein